MAILESIGEMSVLGRPGDTKVIWDRRNSDEVANARRTFDDLRSKGFTAYSVKGEKGEKGEIIREFDPDAERIIMVPRVAGGADEPAVERLLDAIQAYLKTLPPAERERSIRDLEAAAQDVLKQGGSR